MKTFFLNILTVFILFFNIIFAQGQEYNLSFKIVDEITEEPLQNVAIFIEPCSCGGVTDIEGKFSIKLPKNKYKISVSFVGFNDYIWEIELKSHLSLEAKLFKKEEKLSEVIVKAKRSDDNLELPQMGVIKLKQEELKKIPAAVGEFDVLRGMTLLAGVNNSGEVSNGLSVRGGSLDQNLILYDNAPVFNPTHLFGLFSVFTPDVLSSVDLYRGNIPARFGGRATSVLDIKVKTPYINQFKLSGGVGLVSSRLNIETPIIQDKLTLISGSRAGLTDFLLPLFSKRLKNTKARFYDSTTKLLYLPTEKDQISFTGFYSKDFYQLDLITRIENIDAENNQYDFETLNGTLNWLHVFDNQTKLRTIFVASDYNAITIFPEVLNINEIEFESKIKYLNLISEVSKKVNNDMDYYIGVQGNKYIIDPGELDPGSANSVIPVSLSQEIGLELSAFANLNWNPSDNLSLSGGLRFNHFFLQGPFELRNYDETGNNILNTQIFERREKVTSFSDLEPRFGMSLKLNESTSIKASYARANQYLQNIYNSTTPLPTPRWKLSDPNITPQRSDVFGAGFYKNLNNNNWFASDFDRPHVVNCTINFEGDKYNTWSLNFTGQTGRPYTVPNGSVPFENINIPVFLERNNSRLPTYHRLDFSWKVKYSKKKYKRWIGDWTFTIYNAYSRKNPLNIYYSQRNGPENSDIFLDSSLGSFELLVVNAPVFAMTYNFVFQ